MVAKKDLKAQLQRLANIAKHNLGVAIREGEIAYERGQMNAFKAVALSYGIELEANKMSNRKSFTADEATKREFSRIFESLGHVEKGAFN